MAKTKFPVAIYDLDPSCKGYKKGYRTRVETVDSTAFFFGTEKRLKWFLKIHGMEHIDENEMNALRKAIASNRK